MVVVSYDKIERGRLEEHIITLEGHANYDEMGKDIVCASVSILITALASMLDYYDENYESEVVEQGNVDIRYKCNAGDIRTDTVFQMAMEGFELLAFRYPDYVCVT